MKKHIAILFVLIANLSLPLGTWADDKREVLACMAGSKAPQEIWKRSPILAGAEDSAWGIGLRIIGWGPPQLHTINSAKRP